MASNSTAHPHRAVVVCIGGGGVAPPPDSLATVPPGAYVIGADSGVELALELGWAVDLAIGDFDSVDPGALAAAEAGGARVERHPPAKDATDLELALEAAAALDPVEVVVVGPASVGRLDHLLGGLLALAGDTCARYPVRALLGPACVHVVRDRCALDGEPGDLVTLLAVHGPAHGVTTDGLLYPLRGETLHPGSTRGVSNEMTAARATVSVRDGVLLALQPGETGTHHLASGARPAPRTGEPR
ncbi:MAG TPA: thiamine diphosphokinase [Acidimicrobiales bacterium]|nr:thiamine diphosphokinase [Acidimicrobiales bacterium]